MRVKNGLFIIKKVYSLTLISFVSKTWNSDFEQFKGQSVLSNQCKDMVDLTGKFDCFIDILTLNSES